MRRIKAVASPSQLGLWDELDDPAAFHRKDAAPAGGSDPSDPPASVATRPDGTVARPAGRKTP
jgi:hypothetical protein